MANSACDLSEVRSLVDQFFNEQTQRQQKQRKRQRDEGGVQADVAIEVDVSTEVAVDVESKNTLQGFQQLREFLTSVGSEGNEHRHQSAVCPTSSDMQVLHL